MTSAVETTPPRSAESGRAGGSDPAAGAADGERARDLLAGERVWEAAWGAWATARATGENPGRRVGTEPHRKRVHG